MIPIQVYLSDVLFWTEGLAAFVSLLYLNKLRGQYWKYFALYLITIFVFESIGRWNTNYLSYTKAQYYNYLVIPFQFIFLFWLYAAKSLEKKKLFSLFAVIYILSFIPSELFFSGSKIIFSLNYTFGCVLMMILVILEYYKQINSNDILRFYRNKMFYINIGVTVFYIGTLPFMTFYKYLRAYHDLWTVYFSYFLISCIIMYLLFLISIVWGKSN